MARAPRILCLSHSNWPCVERLPLLLVEAGLEVSCITAPGTGLDHIPLARRYRWPDNNRIPEFLATVVEDLQPDFLIPLEDGMVRLIADITRGRLPDFLARHRALLERSLGDLASLPARVVRASLVDLPPGFVVPPTITSARPDALLAFGEAQGWQCIFKTEFSTSGKGVERARDEAGFRRIANALYRENKPFIAQRFFEGPSAARAALAARGQMIAGISFTKLEHAWQFGYGTVMQPVLNVAMAETTARVARHFGISGFFSCDFVIDAETGTPYLLEVNPRVVPLLHLGSHFGIDFAAGLQQLIAGQVVPQAEQLRDGRPIALFPKELMRDPASPWLDRSAQDAPTAYPELMAYYHALREAADRQSRPPAGEGQGSFP